MENVSPTSVVLEESGSRRCGSGSSRRASMVSAQDPVALVNVVLVLLPAGIAGCLGPVRKAARLEPNLLMRESEVSGRRRGPHGKE
jgi:hypothetical protein